MVPSTGLAAAAAGALPTLAADAAPPGVGDTRGEGALPAGAAAGAVAAVVGAGFAAARADDDAAAPPFELDAAALPPAAGVSVAADPPVNDALRVNTDAVVNPDAGADEPAAAAGVVGVEGLTQDGDAGLAADAAVDVVADGAAVAAAAGRAAAAVGDAVVPPAAGLLPH